MGDPVNWKSMTQETVSNLSRLIKTETVNPEGNELQAILVIKDILDKAGFPPESYHILEPATRRANLIARIKGDGSERPLLLSGHVDVVPVEREQWSHDPFGGEVIDGEVWGRGALDMKGFLAMYLEIFLELFRQRIPLKRDVILAAIADEENGFTHGSRLLVEQHRELIEAEYGFTEAGGLTLRFGNLRLYPIQVAEKAICFLRVKTRGKPGHGSIPHADNPVISLSQAIEQLRQRRHLPVHLTRSNLRMLEAFGSRLELPWNRLTGLFKSPMILNLAMDRFPEEYKDVLTALVTNTVSPTMLRAGNKVNVIPSVAEAIFDCRLVPGQTVDDVIKEIHQITGEEIELEPVFTTNGTEFSIETPLYKLLEKRTQQMDPGGLVIPMVLPGATDACQYQKAGIIMYGFTPGVLPAEFPILRLAHGHNERIPISFIETGLPVLWDVVNEFCGKGR